MDDKTVGPAEILAIASVTVFLFALFLPWFEVTVSGDTTGLFAQADLPEATGWDVGVLWSLLPLLLGLALVALLLGPIVASDASWPDIPRSVPVALGGLAAALVLVKLLIGYGVEGSGVADTVRVSTDVRRAAGIYLAFLATLGMVGAGVLALRDTDRSRGGRGGTAPPAPS